MEYAFKIIDKNFGPVYGEIIYAYLKVSEYDNFVAAHPELERYIESAPAVTFNGKNFGSLDAQMPSGFKDVLQKIGEVNPNTELGDNYRKNKTIKEIKTRDTVRAYAKKRLKNANSKKGS